jgi:dihydrofolate reductase
MVGAHGVRPGLRARIARKDFAQGLRPGKVFRVVIEFEIDKFKGGKMRKIIYSIMTSLDGFIEAEDKELDWAIVDEELHQFANDQERLIDTHLYGRKIYEVMNGYWPTADTNPEANEVEVEYAQIWQNITKLVFSKTLEKVEGKARLYREVDPAEIQRLKAQPGKNMGLGGADLAATFIRLGLVDEYQLYIHPVILGGGTPVFAPPAAPSGHPLSLQLIDTRTFGSGVVMLHYRNSDQV